MPHNSSVRHVETVLGFIVDWKYPGMISIILPENITLGWVLPPRSYADLDYSSWKHYTRLSTATLVLCCGCSVMSLSFQEHPQTLCLSSPTFTLTTTERLHFLISLSCIGEGNGNPLQCSCLENPRDGGAWWAAVYGVVQSRTQLKRLSSSSSRPALGVGFSV